MCHQRLLFVVDIFIEEFVVAGLELLQDMLPTSTTEWKGAKTEFSLWLASLLYQHLSL